MFALPRGFSAGDARRWRRVPGLVLAEVEYAAGERVREKASRARFVFVLRGSLTDTTAASGPGTMTHGGSTLIFQPAHAQQAWNVGSAGATCLIVDMDDGWLARANEQAPVLKAGGVFRGGLLAHLAHRLHGEFQLRDDMSRLAIESLALGVLVEASRRVTRPATAVPGWLARARAVVDRRFAERLRLSTVAAAVGVHPVHLARGFRKSYNTTFSTYLRDLRVEHARRQLISTRAPLGQIAVAAGFYDQSHFCRCFKRAVGVRPTEYRLAFRAG